MDAYGPFAASAVSLMSLSSRLFFPYPSCLFTLDMSNADLMSAGESYIDEIWHLGLGGTRLSNYV